MSGKLILVPTPIGNLGDITLRSLETLKNVQLILAEDTRTTGFLLKHYAIHTDLKSYHMHNEHQTVAGIIAQLERGDSIALVSDAGTPGISDPGFLLVREAIKHEIFVESLPGATAFVPALTVSGLPTNDFSFYGFLPIKKGRKTKLAELSRETKTFVLYESPHKIERTLRDLIGVLGAARKASLSREISKKFEETIRGSLGEIHSELENKKRKGEMVLVVEGLKEYL